MLVVPVERRNLRIIRQLSNEWLHGDATVAHGFTEDDLFFKVMASFESLSTELCTMRSVGLIPKSPAPSKIGTFTQAPRGGATVPGVQRPSLCPGYYPSSFSGHRSLREDGKEARRAQPCRASFCTLNAHFQMTTGAERSMRESEQRFQ